MELITLELIIAKLLTTHCYTMSKWQCQSCCMRKCWYRQYYQLNAGQPLSPKHSGIVLTLILMWLAVSNPNWDMLLDPAFQSLRGASNVTRFTLALKWLHDETIFFCEKRTPFLLIEENALLVSNTRRKFAAGKHLLSCWMNRRPVLANLRNFI